MPYRAKSTHCFALLLAACGSAEDTQSSATPSPTNTATCKIDGGYTVTPSRASGTCPVFEGENTPLAVTVIAAGVGKVNITQQGYSGSCLGVVSGCKVTGSCEAKDRDGKPTAKDEFVYNFGPNGFSGSSAVTIFPPTVTATCTANYSLTATAK